MLSIEFDVKNEDDYIEIKINDELVYSGFDKIDEIQVKFCDVENSAFDLKKILTKNFEEIFQATKLKMEKKKLGGKMNNLEMLFNDEQTAVDCKMLHQNLGDIMNENYNIVNDEVLLDKNLKANARLLFIKLQNLSQTKGYCSATNRDLSELFGLTQSSISKLISDLKKEGYIKIEMIRGEFTNEIAERRIFITKKSPKKTEDTAEDVNKNLEKMSDSIKKTEEKTTTKKIDKRN